MGLFIDTLPAINDLLREHGKMTESLSSLDITAPQLVIIANGESTSTQATARGHLFEKFIARLLEAFGCTAPTKSSLNVRQSGYEVDITTSFTLTHESAIAECKAYSSALPLSALSTFYGKLSAERLDNPAVHGWFVVVPGLTADGHEFARKLEAGDKKFKLVTAYQIYDLVRQKDWIQPISTHDGALFSDHGILLSSDGVAAIAKRLDKDTRLPIQVAVRRSSGRITEADLALLAATDYASGLPIQDMAIPTAIQTLPSPTDTQTLVTVVGSGADFEYQFPAAPAFFVGREDLLARVKQISADAGCQGRVIVLNAQSGWGKSSLALRIADQVEASGGTAIVFDTRTATASSYVAAALRKAMTNAERKGQIALPADASFASLQSALRTLQTSTWRKKAPLLIFFDQFENVFRDARLTQEFRDLALAVREIPVAIIIGFSWKTDLVGLIENYPYRLRDEIRWASSVLNVEPFGPREVGTLLGRLARTAGTPLSADLKQRLREYSQGLPWLLKKLASHILKQLQAGTKEETLLAESLNIEGLFEQDLAALEATEVEALKAIAREAPVLVTEIVERVNPVVMQSLVDQRLIVRVGERIDVYWDTFREFLLTNKVAVEDTYILRQRAASTSKLLQQIIKAGGEISTSDAARNMSTSQHVVFNSARDLRQLGVLVPKSGSLLLSEQLRYAPPTESQIRERVARSLRRHTVFAKLQALLNASTSHEISLDTLAAELPHLFPAVEAAPHTWRIYAISFGSWLNYSGLVQLRGHMLCAPTTSVRSATLLSTGERLRKTFPQSGPEPVIEYLRARIHGAKPNMSASGIQKALSDLYVLGVLAADGEFTTHSSQAIEALLSAPPAAALLYELLSNVPGGKNAVALIQADPSVRPEVVGKVLCDAYGLSWAPGTMRGAGSKFRAWASFCGVATKPIKRDTPRA